MRNPLLELLSTPHGTASIVKFDPPGALPGYGVPALAVHSPVQLAEAAGTGKLRRCAMTVSVVEREGVSFLFFGMALHNMLYAFVMNPGQKGVLLFLEYLKAEHKGVVLLVFDERRAAVAIQDLPQDKLAAALAVARRKPIYTPERYNRVLASLVSGRSAPEFAQTLFSQEELRDLAQRAYVGVSAARLLEGAIAAAYESAREVSR